MAAIDDIPATIMNDNSTVLTIQLLLVDTEDITSASKGKAREEMRSDTEIDLKIYRAELERVFIITTGRQTEMC
jgi:hypothetical protein